MADKFRKMGCLNVYGRKRERVGVKQYMHSFNCYHCLLGIMSMESLNLEIDFFQLNDTVDITQNHVFALLRAVTMMNRLAKCLKQVRYIFKA